MNNIPTFKKGWLGGKTELIITSPMGMRGGRPHQGIDVGVSVGTYIESPFYGIVVSKGKRGGYGLQLEIKCQITNEISYNILFAHLSNINSSIHIGTEVIAGQKIAYTGGKVGDPNAGSSTGPHLHLEVKRNGNTRINPINFLPEKCILKGKVIHNGSSNFISEDIANDYFSNYTNVDITSVVDNNATEFKTKKTQVVSGVTQRLAPGIWQIVKLLMDSSVNKRVLNDSSISMMTGSLQSWFNKVCQQPFVEFSGDTYGDQYFFFVRKPPFDLEGINRGLENYKLEITNDEIVSVNLTWNSQNIYSWYQFLPYIETMNMENLQMYLPAVFFPEYAAIWGSKDLTVRSQYVSDFDREYGNYSENEKKEQEYNIKVRTCFSDFKYMIDCNAYAPFVRRGTITLNGDRRIKRGTFIIMPNNEVFYVDAVSNSLSVRESSYSRVTTLTVSHGMFLPFINGKEHEGKIMSYFNLIDYGEGFSIDKVTVDNYSTIVSKWKVNVDVFAFFLKKTQLLYNYARK